MESLSPKSKQFLLDHAAGKKPAVPDSVWFGKDCWVLAKSGYGWRISERGKEALKALQRANQHDQGKILREL